VATGDVGVRDLVERYIVSGAIKQARLMCLLNEDEGWTADIDRGVLTIGRFSFHAEVVGTASEEDGSFLWSWEHPSIPPARASLARRVRERGEALRIPELIEAEVRLDDLGPLEAAVVALGLSEADAWWFGDTDAAAVVFLIQDDALASAHYDLGAFGTLLGDLIAATPFDHRRAFDHFAERPVADVQVEHQPDGYLLARGSEHLAVRFDDVGRIIEVAGTTSPP
jgi:hypothetical protein